MSFSAESPLTSALRAFAWPFTPTPGLFIVSFALALTLASSLRSLFGLLGLIVTLTIWFVAAAAIARYLFLILETTLKGHAQPPVMSARYLNPAHSIGYFLIVVWILPAIVAAESGGSALTAVFVAATTLVMPAILVLSASTGRVFKSLNPALLHRFAATMGPRYLVMIAAIAITPLGLLFHRTSLPGPLANLIALYLMVVGFHLLGRLAYQRREELGIEAEISPEREASEMQEIRERDVMRALDRAHPLSNVREYSRALRSVENAIGEMGADEDILEAFNARLLEWEDPEVGLLMLRKRISDAIRLGATEEAWWLCQRGLQVTRRFHPEKGEEAVSLARYASKAGAHRDALALLIDFDERYPQNQELLPVAAVLEAKIVAEKLGQPEAARKRLRSLCHKFPVCTESDDLLSYLELLTTL